MHEDDLEDVLQRAVEAGCVKMMVTGSCLGSSERGVEMAGGRGEFFLFGWGVLMGGGGAEGGMFCYFAYEVFSSRFWFTSMLLN